MDVASLLLIFIFGTLIGSFLNVVSIRYNTGLSPLAGRSQCVTCTAPLHWYELIPLFSFIFLRGRCRSCGTQLSWQYPLVEFLTGVLLAGVAARQYYYWPVYSAYTHGLTYSLLFFVYYTVVFSLLLVIMLYDLRHKIIPNAMVYSFIGLSLLKLAVFFYCNGFVFDTLSLLDLLAPLILSVPFGLLWVISKGQWIGLGDAKLAFGIGAMLGLVSGLSAIILAFWIGALWSIGSMIYRRNSGQPLSWHSEVPFAPFLVISTFIVFFSHIDVLNLSVLIDMIK